ncbi:MAG: hypothetical protein AAFR37_25820, partial [Cyanobacteria bacterium J06628_3]
FHEFMEGTLLQPTQTSTTTNKANIRWQILIIGNISISLLLINFLVCGLLKASVALNELCI